MFEAEATDMLLVDMLVFRVIVSAEYAGQKVKMVVKNANQLLYYGSK